MTVWFWTLGLQGGGTGCPPGGQTGTEVSGCVPLEPGVFRLSCRTPAAHFSPLLNRAPEDDLMC